MRRILTILLLVFAGFTLTLAANKRTTVAQVKEAVTLTEDVDYVITSATPFAEGGSIDIVNTDHAVVILNGVKPSAAIRLLANYVKINGAKAVNNSNCQVKIYNRGAIILPYGNSAKPLTVYSEPDFGGTAVNDFGTENSGGYMNTLSAAKLNNKIRSFKLKRGYMVTFSTLPSGRGYSRCFIAADKDVEMASLPDVLDQRISSYRVFKWYDTGKKQLANNTQTAALSALNVQSCYDWGQGNNSLLPDYEWVPNHIYEDWPSSATIGGTSQSPHTKNNNEPRNSSDDHPQDLATILGNWENMMRTGLRLCSPASWDGSDYDNATGFLAQFLDSIDARGWRCDIIDLHCYWPESKFNNIHNWSDKYKRPIWISEWCWGASWNNNGSFASGTTEAQVKAALQRICTNLNNWNYVERYYYWNSERDPSKLYKDGKLTPAGEYYASMNSGLGYNGRYDFVPTTPRQYAPSAFSVTVADGTATVKWRDQNGEHNQLMQIERKLKGGQWELLADIEQKEQASNYTYKDENAPEGAQYRLHLIDLNGTSYYTNNNMDAGDAVQTTEGETRYVGGNLLTNGDFDLGTLDWTAGTGAAIGQPYFQVVPVGGIDGGSYLQAYGSAAMNTVQSLKRYVAVQPNTDYIFRCASRNGGANQQLNLSADDKSAGSLVTRLKNTSDWNMQSVTFNSGDRGYVLIAFNTLQAKAQFDKMELRQLFTTRNEAVADGMEKLRIEAKAVMAYNAAPELAALNTELQQRLDALTTADDEALTQGKAAISELLQALADRVAIDSLNTIIDALRQADVALPNELNILGAVAPENYTAQYFTGRRQTMQQALDGFLTYIDAEVQPQSPSFASDKGWETKVGTYTGGDQRTNTYGGKNCWNAWWSGVNASVGAKQTMAIRQKVEKLPEGLYALECKGSTQHYCVTDQHGYLIYNNETLVTPPLTADYMDLPTVGNIWQTLTTPPVYVEDGGTVTIGFQGSKEGAVNNAWHPFGETGNNGDRREGWWCATDFRLLYHPMKKMTTTAGQWGTVCLPYAYDVPAGAKFYKIAGIMKDHSKICLEEITTTVEAGKPVIFLAEADKIVFSEYGEKAKTPANYRNENNMRGFFEATGKAPVDSYVLMGDTWCRVVSTRPVLVSYEAIIYKLDDSITELDSWAGMTMPITDSDYTGINENVNVNENAGAAYTLGGQRATGKRGIVIETNGGKTRKVVRR